MPQRSQRHINATGNAPRPAFAINSPAAQTVKENTVFNYAVVTNRPVTTWAITGGADAAKFTLSPQGMLTLPAKDYEVPDDADTNRVYLVTVQATALDGTIVSQNVAVTVTDVAGA